MKPKIKIVVEDPKKGWVEIPITYAEVGAMYGAGFMLDESYDTFKLNKIDKPFGTLHEKFQHLVNHQRLKVVGLSLKVEQNDK